MSTGTFPIIRLEIEGMKHSVAVALTEYAARMDADVQAAIERACEPHRLVEAIQVAASKAIDDTIKSEIDTFFRYGDGRRAIKAAVEAQLSKQDRSW
jgi:hypothetical protein